MIFFDALHLFDVFAAITDNFIWAQFVSFFRINQ